jgi:hypothetical protein
MPAATPPPLRTLARPEPRVSFATATTRGAAVDRLQKAELAFPEVAPGFPLVNYLPVAPRVMSRVVRPRAYRFKIMSLVDPSRRAHIGAAAKRLLRNPGLEQAPKVLVVLFSAKAAVLANA